MKVVGWTNVKGWKKVKNVTFSRYYSYMNTNI